MSGILSAIEMSARGLSVQREKMNIVAENMANAETVKTREGGPYRRKRVMVTEDQKRIPFNTLLKKANDRLITTDRRHIAGGQHFVRGGEKVSSVSFKTIQDPESNFRLLYDPSHPQADVDGYVQMPDIEIINEMVDMLAATRAYEANAAAISAAKRMADEAMQI